MARSRFSAFNRRESASGAEAVALAPHRRTGNGRASLFRSAGLFAIAALIPFLVFAGVGAYRSLQAERTQQQTQAVDDARLLTAVIDQELLMTVNDAQTLADSPELGARPNLRRFREFADRALAEHPLWLNVVLLDPKTGAWIFQAARPTQKLPQRAMDPESLTRAVRTLKPVIGELSQGPSTDARKTPDWGIPIRAPVIRNGRLLYIATIVIRPNRLQDLLGALRAPTGWTITAVNQDGQVVARSRDAGMFMGRNASPRALKARAQGGGGGGLYNGVSLDHQPTISAYWMSPTTGWSVHVGIPRADFEGRLRRSGLLLGLGLMISLILGVFFLILFLRELESRRSQEAALEQAARLEALGRLTGGVAHDFNNLLTVIQGNVAILRRKVKEPVAGPHLDAIRQAGDQAVKLIRQLLVFARGGVSQTTTLDLDEAVDTALAAVRQLVGPGITVQSRRSESRAHVDIDPIQLEAAILNLAANARDAMPSGGFLELATRVEQERVELSVTDTGEGVPPEVLPRVFDPFFTTKAAGKGTGLGLAQVYGLARSAGGYAMIRSTLGQGTTVTLRLPRAQGEPERVDVQLDPSPRDGEGPRILLVDDDIAVRATVASFLRSSSLTVREATDAAEALALLEAELFDSLVSDIIMPGELDGLALARAARDRRPELPIFLISGYGPSSTDATAAGFTVLPKPLDLADLERRLRVPTRATTI